VDHGKGASGSGRGAPFRVPGKVQVEIDPYEVLLAIAGVAALLAAWLPAYARERPVSMPLVLVGFGLLVFLLPLGVPRPDPRNHLELTERVTEFGVLVALTGAGLKLDRPVGRRAWGSTWRMLAIAMPLTVAAVAGLGVGLLGIGLASAVLLGASMAPTDPVLASDVQVGEPTIERADAPDGEAHEGDGARVSATRDRGPRREDEVRFTLTSEGGLNDALAFPFVYLAIRMADDGTSPTTWLAPWLAIDVVLRLGVALAVGIAVGKLLGIVLFRPPGPLTALAETSQGFVAIAMMLLGYGLTEVLQGYGFLAVFVAAVTVRAAERGHEYHAVLHNFSEQAEHLLVVGLLVAFGGALPVLLVGTRWQEVVLAALVLLVVRPLSGLVALTGSHANASEKRAIAFFGVRGIGSLYYLAYAVSAHAFEAPDELWRVIAITIVGSVVLHGIAATPTMHRLDDARARRVRRVRARALWRSARS
jgi:sodium/hydrogen antiporter